MMIYNLKKQHNMNMKLIAKNKLTPDVYELIFEFD
jgi:hypothetical protein